MEPLLVAFVSPVIGAIAGLVVYELRRRSDTRRVRDRVVGALLGEPKETGRTLAAYSEGPNRRGSQEWGMYPKRIAGYRHGGAVFDALLAALNVLPKEIVARLVAFHAQLKDLRRSAEIVAMKQRADIVGRDINLLKDKAGELAREAGGISTELGKLAGD